MAADEKKGRRMPRKETSPKPAGDAAALLALAGENGLKGVRQSQALLRVPLEAEGLAALAQRLEEEGKIRILAFTPLHFISRESVDFLAGKIVAVVTRYHENNPEERGLVLDKLRHRIDAPAQVLSLAVRLLVHDGTLRQEGPVLALSGFEQKLPPREEMILSAFEERCREVPGHVLDEAELRDDLHLTTHKFESVAEILVERKKIVRTKEGFVMSRAWLDGIIAGVRSSPKAELAVSAFKEMTGLSRKFAIPLLELLDELGVTRRRGAAREIVR
jgi:selenocysteine-specific elongation factor